MAILILGSTGQVGSYLLERCKRSILTAVGLSRSQVDLSSPETLHSQLNEAARTVNPTALINAAGYTQVDQAEKEQELARRANTESVKILTEWCKNRNLPFIHYSTDYVFPGTGSQAWKEEDPVEPLNYYGRTKLEGEKEIQRVGGKWLVFRTSWLYCASGKNFFRTMLRLGADREEVRVVNDQIGAPTYAPHLANATLSALTAAEKQLTFPSGVYHLCNGGETSWYGFATKIFELANQNGINLKLKKLQSIPTSEYVCSARRPLNSRLNTDKAKAHLGVSLPSWQVGLEDCMAEYLRSSKLL